MHVTFYGGVREVTGSMHVLSANGDRIMLDCGMFQGRRRESWEKNRTLPLDPAILTNVVLSHAHIDHSGRIPLLARKDFSGRVICTRATADACEYLLMDSAHIQESDAAYLNYKTVRSMLVEMRKAPGDRGVSSSELSDIKKMLKKGAHELDAEAIGALMDRYRLEHVEPLYTAGDARDALKMFDGYPYGHPVTIGKGITCTFHDAGHILGSALSSIRIENRGRRATVCFTGDIGRFGKPILRNPTLQFPPEETEVDLLIMESTYGDRVHEPVGEIGEKLKNILTETVGRGGTLLIPAFAYGRTQELIYMLHELYDSGQVPRVPIYVDSPLAVEITKIFGEHPEVYDRQTHESFLQEGRNPFSFGQIRFVSAVEESMALNRDPSPHIVISASGMCEAGRILHHLRHKVHSAKNTVLIVGFMAQHTLGRRILEKGIEYEASGRRGRPPVIKILNKEYPLKAHVAQIGGFSAHADRNEMLRFLKTSNLKVKKIALVHGEADQTLAFADFLRSEGFDVSVPRLGETMEIADA